MAYARSVFIPIIAWCAGAAVAPVALAQDGLFGLPADPIDEPLVSDRPKFTQSALATPVGRLQVEAGFTFSTDDDSDSDLWTVPEALLRLGLMKDVELRLELPSIAFLDNGRSDDGLTDSSFGVKWRFVEGEGSTPDLAIIGQLSIPTGEDPFGQDGVHPSAILAAGWDLDDQMGDGWTFDANVGLYELEGSDWDMTWSASLGIPIDSEWGAFIEYYAISPELSFSRTAHVIDGGFTYLIHNNLQLDFRIGFGLSDEAPDFLTGAGVSYRF